MNTIWRATSICLAIAVCCGAAGRVEAGRYVAYSLREAESRFAAGQSTGQTLMNLGGMTDPLAVVYDKARKDLIVVGRIDPAMPLVKLDDLVVSMRAILKHNASPWVSIDPEEHTARTGRQTVNFGGRIAGTSFGKAMFEADVVLKELALGFRSADVWGVRSFFDMFRDFARQASGSGTLRSRFWFVADEQYSSLADREGVMVVNDLAIRTETRFHTTTSERTGRAQQQLDALSVRFSQSLSTSFPDLRAAYPELLQLDALFKLVALATGVYVLSEKYESFDPGLTYWLERHRVAAVSTPETYPLRSRKQAFRRGRTRTNLELEGGVELRALVLELSDGSLTALRDIVVRSRPRGNQLTWSVPLEAWHAPDVDALRTTSSSNGTTYGDLGTSVRGVFYPADSPRPEMPSFRGLEGPGGVIPSFRTGSSLGTFSPNIGGVMLSGTAQVAGAERPQVSLAGGNFSLVVDGQDARIDPRLFRKFVTALWCVYYSDQAPGISIDPPPRDGDGEVPMEEFMQPEKHSVRYIGRVLHTDLGRVMREADYLMKKWAVGSGRPDYPNFRSVDAYSARLGATNVGISRRFWFVPEDLRFRRGGDLLLFDAGRIRLLTEYNRDGMRGRAGPADEAFANFFTEHYDGIAETAPVFEELFEYAKLVSLAKYLKEQGVPLHWFLMANKDLVLMEHSPPAVVDAFIRESDHVRGMAMKGGVDLASTPSFRTDAAAEAALQQALARVPAAPGPGGRTPGHVPAGIVPRNVSFEVAGEHYTVLPQHSLTSGRDHRGLRYQTDVALQHAGRPALELVRYFNPRRRESGQFGRGWHLLIPYRVQPAGRQTRPFLNVTIPRRMAVENLLSGTREVLTFDAGHDLGAAYVPENGSTSQVVGLFLMSDGSFRMADKLGNQFHFDSRGRMTDMRLSPAREHRMDIEYVDRYTAAFVQPAYVARPVGEQWVDFLNARIPGRIEVRDRVNDHVEVLAFSAENDVPGYVPDDAEASRFRVAALLTNGGLEVLDRHGNRIRLTPGWDFDSILPAPDRQMVRSVSMGGRQVTFGYTLDGQGQVVIATAAVAEDAPDAKSTWVVRYEYDADGRLCRVHPPADSPRPKLSALYR